MLDIETTEKLYELYDKGLSKNEIIKELNIDNKDYKYYVTTVARNYFKKRKARNIVKSKFEEAVKEIVPKVYSYNQLCVALGLKGNSEYYKQVKNVIEKNNLDISHFGTKCVKQVHHIIRDDEWFSKGELRQGQRTIDRLVKGNYREYKCECCGINEWNGKRIQLELHHKNGDRTDNTFENIQILCPICHSQTDNYCRPSDNIKESNSFKVTKEINNYLYNKEVSYKLPDEFLNSIKVSDSNNKIAICPVCGKEFIKNDSNQKFCSHDCSHKYRSININKNDILNAFKELKTWSGTAKSFGISDKGLVKISKRLGIYDELRSLQKIKYGDK
jgi:hypothetical protein